LADEDDEDSDFGARGSDDSDVESGSEDASGSEEEEEEDEEYTALEQRAAQNVAASAANGAMRRVAPVPVTSPAAKDARAFDKASPPETLNLVQCAISTRSTRALWPLPLFMQTLRNPAPFSRQPMSCPCCCPVDRTVFEKAP
jgi:hypothetical protein